MARDRHESKIGRRVGVGLLAVSTGLGAAACGSSSSPNRAPIGRADASASAPQSTPNPERTTFEAALRFVENGGGACVQLSETGRVVRTTTPKPPLPHGVKEDYYEKGSGKMSKCVTDEIGSRTGEMIGLISTSTDQGSEADISVGVAKGTGAVDRIVANTTAPDATATLYPGEPFSQAQQSVVAAAEAIINASMAGATSAS